MTRERQAQLLAVIADEALSLHERHEAVEEAVHSDRLPLQQRLGLLHQLADHGAPGVYDVCVHWLCHGGPAQRQAAVTVALRLRDDRAPALLDILWQSADLNEEQRIVVAVGLLRAGNRIGEAFLEGHLRHPQAAWRAFVAAPLAGLGNPRALAEMENLACGGHPHQWDAIRFLFLRNTGISLKLAEGEWATAVLAWVAEQRTQHCLGT